MANLIQATVYQIDGNPQSAAITLAFPTDSIAIRAATLSNIDEVNSAIRYYSNPNNALYFQDFYVSEEIADLVSDAGAEQIQTTVIEIDGNIQIPDGVEWSFPPKLISISEHEDTDTGVNSIITFKGSTYSSTDTEDDLVTAANAGGGGGLPYKEYTANLTLPNVVSSTSGLLVVGKTYQIQTLEAGDDFTNVGYTGVLSFVATGTTPTTWTNSTVVTNCTDTIPTANVICDSLGITADWISPQIGDYVLLFVDLPQPEAKCFMPSVIGWNNNGNAAAYIPLSDGSAIIGYYILNYSGFGDGFMNNLSFEFFNTLFEHVHMSDLIGSQGIVPIKFYVYN